MTMSKPSAAVILIGDELLSGRTRDINLKQIADYLAPLGIPVKTCRIVGDEQADIVAAVNALRHQYTYVFTTGGIGPTHDDITADAIGAAFDVAVEEHPGAVEELGAYYKNLGRDFTMPRRRMTRVPVGASLIKNPVSVAPGFQTGNVFTLAGVPSIVRAMLEDVGHRLESGAVVHSVTVRGAGGQEGSIAIPLGELADQEDQVSLGSYPWFKSVDDHGVSLVARSTDKAALGRVEGKLVALFEALGIEASVLTGEEA